MSNTNTPREIKCVAGCKQYEGGEIKHHKDCLYYPDSLSRLFDEQQSAVQEIVDSVKENILDIMQKGIDDYKKFQNKHDPYSKAHFSGLISMYKLIKGLDISEILTQNTE